LKTVLAIAATDPTAGAGLLADVKVLTAFGVYAYAAVTAVTVQSRAGPTEVRPVPADLLEAQIRAIAGDAPIAAIKVGALATGENAAAVARAVGSVGAPVVLDPVLATSGGASLLDELGRRALVQHVLPIATLVTPNLAEAAALSGVAVSDRGGMERAARALAALGARAVLVKGGHLSGSASDLLWADGRARWFDSPRIEADLRGTGCALSSAVAAGLALGRSLPDAVGQAREYVRALLEAGSAVPGSGPALADHLGPFRARALGDDRA
jgi:hydroxymethylpyrimidine/phosphomethylpyrimidine kinase